MRSEFTGCWAEHTVKTLTSTWKLYTFWGTKNQKDKVKDTKYDQFGEGKTQEVSRNQKPPTLLKDQVILPTERMVHKTCQMITHLSIYTKAVKQRERERERERGENLDRKGLVVEMGLGPNWRSGRPIELWSSCRFASAAGPTQQVTGNGHDQECQYYRKWYYHYVPHLPISLTLHHHHHHHHYREWYIFEWDSPTLGNFPFRKYGHVIVW